MSNVGESRKKMGMDLKKLEPKQETTKDIKELDIIKISSPNTLKDLYAFEEKIYDAGDRSKVFLAHCRKTDRNVVVKMRRKEFFSGDEQALIDDAISTKKKRLVLRPRKNDCAAPAKLAAPLPKKRAMALKKTLGEGGPNPMTVLPTPSKESTHHVTGDSLPQLSAPPLVPTGLPSSLASDEDVGTGGKDNTVDNDLTYGLQGTLDAMCSETEMALRQKCRQLDRFELALASTLLNPAPEPKLCVKKYQRSAADKQYNDDEIRTFAACGRSMDHLLDKVLHIDELERKTPPFAEICQYTTFIDIYSFFRDRMRAIRVDLHVQQPRSLSQPIYFLIHEQCLRFELLSMFLLRQPGVTLTQYDDKLGVKACSQTIDPLLHAYSRHPPLQATASCPAMYRYIILLQIGSTEWSSFTSKLEPEVLNHHLVKWALTAVAYFCAEDYTRYLRMYRESDFISGVIMSRSVDYVRYRVLYNILGSFVMNAKEISWTVSQLQSSLAIEDRAFCVSFLEYYGIWVEDAEKVRFPRRLGHNTWDVAEWEKVLDAETAARFRDRIGSGVKPMDSPHLYPRNQDYGLVCKYKNLGITRAQIVRGECDPRPVAPRSRSSAVSACSSHSSVAVSACRDHERGDNEEEKENDEEENEEGKDEDSFAISTSIRKAESGSGVIATKSSMPSMSPRISPPAAAGAGISCGSYPPSGGLNHTGINPIAAPKKPHTASSSKSIDIRSNRMTNCQPGMSQPSKQCSSGVKRSADEAFLTSNKKIGTVKSFNGQLGYGFIIPEDGSEDVFVHYSRIKIFGFKSLRKGDYVEFKWQYSEKRGKPWAADVRVIEYAGGGYKRGRW